MTFLFVDGNKRSTEVLDKFEGVTSVFKNVASGILADKPTFDNGSIKLGTDVDVAVMGNDYFDFNSVQLVVASSDTELKTYDIRQLLAENGTDSADSADTDSITSALSRKDDAKKMVQRITPKMIPLMPQKRTTVSSIASKAQSKSKT